MRPTTRQQTMQRMFFDQQRELDKARIKLEECELADCFNHRDIESLREENAKLLKENAHLKKRIEQCTWYNKAVAK